MTHVTEAYVTRIPGAYTGKAGINQISVNQTVYRMTTVFSLTTIFSLLTIPGCYDKVHPEKEMFSGLIGPWITLLVSDFVSCHT